MEEPEGTDGVDGVGTAEVPAAAAEVPAAAFFEAEAEESGEEAGGAGGSDDEDPNDTGEDLVGFIAQEGEAEAEAEGGDESSSSSDGVFDVQELEEEDLAVLADAGLDVSQVRRGAAAPAEGEPPAKRVRRAAEEPGGAAGTPRSAADDLAAELFGTDEEDVAGEPGPAPAAHADVGMSDAESVDDFVVDDSDATRRRPPTGEAEEFGVSEEQLKEIVEIFGDQSVLRSTDQVVEAQPEPPRPPNLEALQMGDPEVEGLVEGLAGDPDLCDKTYMTSNDITLEKIDAPERWMKAYHSHPELLDANGSRRWADNEHECEAKWIYREVFSQSDLSKPEAEAATREILNMLHARMLEPIHVITQYGWKFQQLFRRDDIWKIYELDQRWQSLWVLFTRLSEWTHLVGETRLPAFITETVNPSTFEQEYAEYQLKDAHDWFIANCPEVVYARDGAKYGLTSEAQKLAQIRACRYDEKLGISESMDYLTLKIFGITPTELGENVKRGEQVTQSMNGEGHGTVDQVCDGHRQGPFRTTTAVLEAIIFFLSRLIACDPRIRDYVRKQFWKMCAVSTCPTLAGKPVAHEAAHSFKKKYRGFHVTNRPVLGFDKQQAEQGDLFLELLSLKRQQLVELEYSLIVKSKNGDANDYVALGLDEDELATRRKRLAEYIRALQSKRPFQQTGWDSAELEWCKKMKRCLESVFRSREAANRKKGAQESKDKAQAIFLAASVECNNPDDLTKLLKADPIFVHLLSMYCYTEIGLDNKKSVMQHPWNDIRKRVILRALRDELYPMMWSEVQASLARKAENVVCSGACTRLLSMIDMQPPRLSSADLEETAEKVDKAHHSDWSDERMFRKEGYCSVLVVAADDRSDTCVVCFVNAFGDPVDSRLLFSDFTKSRDIEVSDTNSFQYLKLQKVKEHNAIFKKLVSQYKPAIILLPIFSPRTEQMKANIQTMLTEPELAKMLLKPSVLLGDPCVPRAVAYHPRLMKESVYRDCEQPLQRIAISAARYIQDPLAETCQLWHEAHDENGLFSLRLHRLQDVVPRDRLATALMVALMDTLAKVGVHVNRMRRSVHLLPMAVFAPGLGPRKVRVLQRCLNTERATSRSDFAKLLVSHLRRKSGEDIRRSPVFINLEPFLRICTDPRDKRVELKVEALERTRLGPEFRPWIRSLCQVVLQSPELADSRELGHLVQKDLDPVTEAMELASREGMRQNVETALQDVRLDDWAALVGMKEFPQQGDQDRLLSILIEEIVEPFKDQRAEFQSLDESLALYIALGESEDTFARGTLVHAVVRKDTEFSDMPSRSERHTVRVAIVPSLVMATIPKSHKQGPIAGCDRKFEVDAPVVARVVFVRSGDNRAVIHLSVDSDPEMWYKVFPVEAEDEPYFVPFKDENWTRDKLGLHDTTATQKKEELKSWVTRPRNIRHLNWTNDDYTEALQLIRAFPVGNVLFRPSKRFDILLAMLKVFATDQAPGDERYVNVVVDPEKCFRQFDVLEQRGENTVMKGFELANKLEVDGVVYKDFDEIIARHMDPIMDHLRLLMEHPKFGLNRGDVIKKDIVAAALKKQSKEYRGFLYYTLLLHDRFPGHGLLVWTLGGTNPREEFLEVTPQGYSLWGRSFETLAQLTQWFKFKGWRHASDYRKEFTQAWQKRHERRLQLRGPDASAGSLSRAFGGYEPESTRSGLQTPGGIASSATPFHGMETSAPTPGGLRTPGGFRTPSGLATPARTGLQTPVNMAFGTRTPDTRPRPAAFPAPSTPASVLLGLKPQTR